MTKDQPRRIVRENLDAFGIAILMAILLKYFAIEAYQIPTSSMQPTMMGSTVAGVYDRIVVDKFRYELFGPKRWDITVFRYPGARNQNYVKRMVGMPGERLRVAGGNVYQVVGQEPGKAADLQILRKPDAVQRGIWKQLFPARHILNGGGDILGNAFSGGRGNWTEKDGVLTLEQRNERSPSMLTYTDGGLVNLVYDGYPNWIAQLMMGEPGVGANLQSVQDVRFAFTITPDAVPDELQTELAVHHDGGTVYRFQLEVQGGKGRIVVRVDGDEKRASEPFDVPLAAGRTTWLGFAHVDDRCLAWVDGDLAASLDTDEFKTIRPLIPSGTDRAGSVILSLTVRGGTKLVFADLEVDRDLHYVPTTTPGKPEFQIIEVPDGHYFMLGDNTLQSVDSRDWTGITLGMLPDGTLVDPQTHPEAKKLLGNKRPMPLSEDPDPDENPVVVQSRGKVVFIDEVGERWALDGAANLDAGEGGVYGPGTPWFVGEHGAWEPESSATPFVRREHIIGRALFTFWPVVPFRLGFIR